MRGAAYVLFFLLPHGAAHASADMPCRRPTASEITTTKNFWTDEQKQHTNAYDLPPFAPKSFLELKRPSSKDLYSISSYAVTAATTKSATAAVSTLTVAPFESIGHFFFRDPYNSPDHCTAFFIDEQTVLMTAAHCVRPWTSVKSVWSTYTQFTRAYNSGKGVGFDFEILLIGVVNEWTKSPDHVYDYAFMLVSATSVPALTFDWGSPTDLMAVGYPKSAGGLTMHYADGKRGKDKYGMRIMEDNPLGRGASGGPWIPPAAGGGNGSSVFSIGSEFVLDTYQGPPLTARMMDLFKKVRDNTLTGCD